VFQEKGEKRGGEKRRGRMAGPSRHCLTLRGKRGGERGSPTSDAEWDAVERGYHRAYTTVVG